MPWEPQPAEGRAWLRQRGFQNREAVNGKRTATRLHDPTMEVKQLRRRQVSALREPAIELRVLLQQIVGDPLEGLIRAPEEFIDAEANQVLSLHSEDLVAPVRQTEPGSPAVRSC